MHLRHQKNIANKAIKTQIAEVKLLIKKVFIVEMM